MSDAWKLHAAAQGYDPAAIADVEEAPLSSIERRTIPGAAEPHALDASLHRLPPR